MKSAKPETDVPSELFYSERAAARYHANSRVRAVQREMAERCLELLELPAAQRDSERCLLLDIGCGSGLSGQVLSEAQLPWLGVDNSPEMLQLASAEAAAPDATCLDLLRADIGAHSALRTGVFDGAISVSTVQWLCTSFERAHDPLQRVGAFFRWLFRVLKPAARAALQFYPASEEQPELLRRAATKAGFRVFFALDSAESRKKKVYMVCLMPLAPASALTESCGGAPRARVAKPAKCSAREALLARKSRLRRKGVAVRADSKYSGRRRSDRF